MRSSGLWDEAVQLPDGAHPARAQRPAELSVRICEPWRVERLPLEHRAEPTQFAELNDLLMRFVTRVCSILGAKLVGVYLTGSFALGSGDAASDCDFIAVSDGGLSRGEERELRMLHEEILSWPSYWAYNLEGSYAPQSDLTTLLTLRRPWLYVNRGSREMEWSPHCNTEDVRWILVNRPLILAGIDSRAFVCDVPAWSCRRRCDRRSRTSSST